MFDEIEGYDGTDLHEVGCVGEGALQVADANQEIAETPQIRLCRPCSLQHKGACVPADASNHNLLHSLRCYEYLPLPARPGFKTLSHRNPALCVTIETTKKCFTKPCSAHAANTDSNKQVFLTSGACSAWATSRQTWFSHCCGRLSSNTFAARTKSPMPCCKPCQQATDTVHPSQLLLVSNLF